MSRIPPKPKTDSLYQEAKHLIPGGSQLLSKRPEMYAPNQWPAYFERAKGVEVWDLDGNHYIDCSLLGIGSCVLGYADPDVDRAVGHVIGRGVASTLNGPEEVRLARLLIHLHPWADMARFTRSGGEAMAVAVRIARAHTGRDRVLVCGYHGWHDWYLAGGGHLKGLTTKGVPDDLLGTTQACIYNDLTSFRQWIYPHNVPAAIVMEVTRSMPPNPGFLEGIRAMCDEFGIILIFDEITSGFRVNVGGVHLTYQVPPDIGVYAKAISNGYAMAAVIGKGDVMSAAQDTFISSTNWTERVGPTAALTTIYKFWAEDVAIHITSIGRAVQQGWREAAENAGLAVSVTGLPPLAHIDFDSKVLDTLFTQEMLKRGYLAGPNFYACYAHTLEHVEEYLKNVREVFLYMQLTKNTWKSHEALDGPVAHSGFQRIA